MDTSRILPLGTRICRRYVLLLYQRNKHPYLSDKITRAENDMVLVLTSNLCLVIVWVVEIDLTSVWGIRIDLISV